MQLCTVEIYRPDECIVVVATAEYTAGILVGTIKVSYGCKIALATIAIGGLIGFSYAPVYGAVGSAAIGHVAVRIIVHGVDGFSRQALEHGQPLLTACDAAVTIAVEGSTADRLDGGFGGCAVDIASLSVL